MGSLHRSWGLRRLCLVGALLLYAGGALARTFSLRPYNNEAWFANPAVDLLVRHRMGTPILAGAGTWLAGIEWHTYWTMPLYALVQAAWYWCFGFGLITQRLLTSFCGLVLLLSVYVFVKKLTSAWAATLAAVLISCDFEFVKQAGQGRMDMLSACLGFAGLAIYVNLRETRLRAAVLLSNAGVAASCMTHPCGVLPLTALWAITFYLDRKRLGWKEVALAAGPYALALALWGFYIAQAPGDFVTQLRGNSRGMQAEIGGRERFNLLAHPLRTLSAEVHVRYFDNYHSALVPLVYFCGWVAVTILAWKTRSRAYIVLALVVSIYVIELTWLEGVKREFYLVHSIPALAMVLAVVVCSLKVGRRWGRVALCVAMAGLVGYQCATQIRNFRNGQGIQEYFAAANFIDANYSKGAILIAPAEFAYRFGFYGGLIDDWRLGYYDRTSPDLLVVGGLTRAWVKQHRNDTADFREFVDKRLGGEYVVVFDNPTYTIYARQQRAASISHPGEDTEHKSMTKMLWGLRAR